MGYTQSTFSIRGDNQHKIGKFPIFCIHNLKSGEYAEVTANNIRQALKKIGWLTTDCEVTKNGYSHQYLKVLRRTRKEKQTMAGKPKQKTQEEIALEEYCEAIEHHLTPTVIGSLMARDDVIGVVAPGALGFKAARGSLIITLDDGSQLRATFKIESAIAAKQTMKKYVQLVVGVMAAIVSNAPAVDMTIMCYQEDEHSLTVGIRAKMTLPTLDEIEEYIQNGEDTNGKH